MQPPFTQARFLELYPLDTQIQSGKLTLDLRGFFAMEEAFCTAPNEARTDAVKRVCILAGAVFAAGNLRPEDHNLLHIAPKIEG